MLYFNPRRNESRTEWVLYWTLKVPENLSIWWIFTSKLQNEVRSRFAKVVQTSDYKSDDMPTQYFTWLNLKAVVSLITSWRKKCHLCTIYEKLSVSRILEHFLSNSALWKIKIGRSFLKYFDSRFYRILFHIMVMSSLKFNFNRV